MVPGNVVAEISVVPLGTASPSLSHYVAGCMEVLESCKNICYELTPMSTIVEGPMDMVIEAARKLHEFPFDQGVSRVLTTLKIDDRRDKVLTMNGKVASVVKKYPRTKTKTTK